MYLGVVRRSVGLEKVGDQQKRNQLIILLLEGPIGYFYSSLNLLCIVINYKRPLPSDPLRLGWMTPVDKLF